MKKNFILLNLLFIVSIVTAQPLQVTPGKIKQVDSLYNTMFKPTDAGIVVILAQNGKPLFKKAYGMANIELSVPLNTDHKFGIGSISKQFASVAILLLQQEGKLHIDDDIRKFLPSYNTWGRSISIRNILSHTSGIPSYTEIYYFDTLAGKKISIDKLIKFFESRPLIFEPGTNWSYSNSGYVLAAKIVEKISGMPFNDFLQKRIFQPLLMTETSFGSSEYAPKGKTAEYVAGAKGPIKVEASYDWYWAYGAGQIISTADDMLKWNEALNDPNFLKSDLLKLAHESFILKDGSDAHYGLGWAVDQIAGKKVIQHGGAIGGYRSQGLRIPDDGLYLLVLSNSGNTNTSLVMNRSLSILYDKSPLKEQKNDIQSWKEIEGIYESLNAGSRLQANFGSQPAFYTIRVDSLNKVTFQRTGGGKNPLTPGGKDLLFDKNAPFTAWKVERDEKGAVQSLRLEQIFPASGPARSNKRISTVIPSAPQEVKADSLFFAQFNGTYEHEYGDRAKITAVKDGLIVEPEEGGPRSRIVYIGNDSFWFKDLNTIYYFETNKKTKQLTMRYFNGSYEILMQRVVDLY